MPMNRPKATRILWNPFSPNTRREWSSWGTGWSRTRNIDCECTLSQLCNIIQLNKINISREKRMCSQIEMLKHWFAIARRRRNTQRCWSLMNKAKSGSGAGRQKPSISPWIVEDDASTVIWALNAACCRVQPITFAQIDTFSCSKIGLFTQ